MSMFRAICIIGALALAGLACDDDVGTGAPDTGGDAGGVDSVVADQGQTDGQAGDRGADAADAAPDAPADALPDGACLADASRSCYSGPSGTQGVGACKAGTQLCAGGVWGPCTGQVKPGTETCDSADNDCNGKVDDLAAQVCYTGPQATDGVGQCKGGTQTCGGGKWSECSGQVLPGTEICDNKDNDCDGKVDNGVTQSCYTGAAGTAGVGQCKSGTQSCTAGQWGSCTGEVVPGTETCDNTDQDCDGTADNGVTQSCYTGAKGTAGVGLCKAGTQSCAAGQWGKCAGEVTPTTETCDNKDQDCDGTPDNGVTQSCYTGAKGTAGVGLCKAGTQSCAAGQWSKCAGQVTPKAETCDNKDEDCDGKPDNGVTQSCYTGAKGTAGVGLCKAGTQSCAAGKWGTCAGQVTPKTETCDNKDEDCDGKPDDGVTQSCYTGAKGTAGVGLCKAGKQSCAAGKWGSCTGQVTPVAEKCDAGKDNDCDGKTDEVCGCSDGTREGFVDATKYSKIAGCSGGWSVKGVLTAKAPKCKLVSGNSSANPSGKGCAAEDLCAAGWHICKTPAEVKAKSPTGCTGVATAGSLFFSTRQSGPGSGSCGSGANDIFGCGTYGATPSSNCSPLNKFGHDLCSALGSPWSCGGHGYQEANNVIKSSSAKGGVLCCVN